MPRNDIEVQLMDWFTGIIVFLLIWWLAIFTVLPFGLRRDAQGKPDDPRLVHKLVATTVLSVLVWLVLYVLIEVDIISFREMALHMAEQDALEQ